VRVLLVQDNADLGAIWQRFLHRHGIEAHLVTTQAAAMDALEDAPYDALVLELVLPDGGGIAVADFAAYKNPEIPVIAVTKSSFFSDGSVFEVVPNARCLMRTPLRPDDLVAWLEHCTPKPSSGSARTA
jgi:DNA-binding response OmpR family regulator